MVVVDYSTPSTFAVHRNETEVRMSLMSSFLKVHQGWVDLGKRERRSHTCLTSITEGSACLVRTYSSEHGRTKPHSSIYLDTLARLKVEAREALYVGDRIWQDVWGAQNAGMRAVLVEVPYRRQRKDEVQPDGRIRSLPGLVPLVDGWMRERG